MCVCVCVCVCVCCLWSIQVNVTLGHCFPIFLIQTFKSYNSHFGTSYTDIKPVCSFDNNIKFMNMLLQIPKEISFIG